MDLEIHGYACTSKYLRHIGKQFSVVPGYAGSPKLCPKYSKQGMKLKKDVVSSDAWIGRTTETTPHTPQSMKGDCNVVSSDARKRRIAK